MFQQICWKREFINNESEIWKLRKCFNNLFQICCEIAELMGNKYTYICTLIVCECVQVFVNLIEYLERVHAGS